MSLVDRWRKWTRRPALKAASTGNLAAFDKQHIQLSVIFPFYFDKKSNASLLYLLKQYESLPSDIRDRVQFVVVDDGSPDRFPLPDLDLNITWLRITENIPWNLSGARNLGVVYAKSDKIVLMDLDHEIPEITMRKLLRMRNPGRRLYRFWRYTTRYKKFARKAHANTFFMSRARFFRFYGYDEEFAGHYGYVGGSLSSFHRYHGSLVLKLSKKYHLIRNDDEGIDADHTLQRDRSHNRTIYWRKRDEIKQWGAEAGHSRQFLNFDWEISKEHSRPRPAREIDTWWIKWKWFRSLFGTY